MNPIAPECITSRRNQMPKGQERGREKKKKKQPKQPVAPPQPWRVPAK